MSKRFLAALSISMVLLVACAAGCSSNEASKNTPEPYKVSKTIVTKCLDGVFEMEIPEGMKSSGTSSYSKDDLNESFYPEKGGTSSSIFILQQEISPYLGADKFAAEYFDKPPSDATYTYKNIKVEKMSGGHYISSADIYEKDADESNKKEICFSVDGDKVIYITIENIQKVYTNNVASTIKIL